ncbi:MAG: hypothetical protein ACLQBK_12140 [Candidatus Sulfotelmatobacter sp.]
MRKSLWTLSFLLLVPGTGWGQAGRGDQSAGSDAQNQIPQVDLGQDNSLPADENAQDLAQDESRVQAPSARTRSLLRLGIHVGEGVENNPSGILGYSSQVSSVTNLFGSVGLQKLSRRSETTIDYIGGGSLYDNYGSAKFFDEQSQQLSAEESILWTRGRLTFSDSFTYAGAGTFGSSPFGGAGAYNLRFTGLDAGTPNNTALSNLPIPTQFAQVGQEAYAINDSGLTLSETLTARSSVFAGGDYAITDYFGNQESTFDSRQVAVTGGYNYQVSQKEMIGVSYGYQAFRFPDSDAGNLVTHSAQFIYKRTISTRTDLVLGGGPEFINFSGGNTQATHQIGATGQALLTHRWEKSNLSLSYNRLVTGGSGFFAGATTDIALLSVNRTFHRSWSARVYGGYVRSQVIGSNSAASSESSYRYGFSGAAVQRRLGRSLSAFASYQFDAENFSNCLVSVGCDPVIRRHSASIGLDWYVHPIRLE